MQLIVEELESRGYIKRRESGGRESFSLTLKGYERGTQSNLTKVKKQFIQTSMFIIMILFTVVVASAYASVANNL